MLTRLARFAVRRPVVVLTGWALAVVVLALIGRGVEDKLYPTQLLVPGTETHRWSELRKGHFGEDAAVLLTGPADAIDRQGPALTAALQRRRFTRAISPWSGGGRGRQLRPSPEQALIVLDLGVPKGQNVSTIVPPLERFVAERTSPPVEAHLSGLTPLGRDINDASIDSLRTAELIAFPVLLIVLLLVFRTPIAAAIPLIAALGTLQGGAGVISIIAEFAKLDAIALSLASMIGLALGVDYSLLIVSRFREGLEQGQTPRQAASLAANTAGRTAVFAGTVLIGIMLVSFVLSPGSVLLSASVGSVVVTVLSMLGAALVTPSAVALLGHRVNMWRLGRAPREGMAEAGAIGRIVRRVIRRPALVTTLVLSALLIVAAPVLAIDTIPPDPRQLPKGNEGLEAFNQVRRAGFGPSVDVVIKAPDGAVTDPDKLRQIERLERRFANQRFVKFVVGPGAIGQQTRAIRTAPRSIRRGERKLEEGKRDLARLERGLDDATGGVGELRDGLSEAAAGAARLEAGSARAKGGAEALGAGTERAQSGVSRLQSGLDRAHDAAARLARGAARARRGSTRLARGNARLRDALEARLAPGADELARGLRQGQAELQELRAPAQVTERELRNAFQTLQAMTVGKTDPLFAQALRQVGTALGGATGRNPLTGQVVSGRYQGLDASLAQAADGAGQAADGAEQLAAGARDAASAARRLGEGAGDLASGLRRLERGSGQLESGIGEIRTEVSASSGGFERLAAGATELAVGLTRLRAGTGQLRSGLESGADGSAPLESGLGSAADEVGTVNDQLTSETGPFRPLRSLRELNRRSPGFFESGYVVVAAIDGGRPLDRESALFLVDSSHGGGVGRVQVLPDVPTNDPRTAEVVDEVTRATRDFEKTSGLTAAVGGSAGELVDYDRATSARLPWLVILISLVTYLTLVPILRSLFLPMIAVVLNLITVAVGFGVLTLLFVGDNPPLGGAGALDVITVAGIFSITFALSIDYQVFLLTRMREEFVRTQSNEKAIQFGIEKTGKVVTGAAAIMVGVFVAFALSKFVIIRQFGVGLATAVLIDATIVRLVLLPAVMRLFGLNTWWIPNWLDERLPLLDVEGAAFHAETEQMRPRLSET